MSEEFEVIQANPNGIECECCRQVFKTEMYKWKIPTYAPGFIKYVYCSTCKKDPGSRKCTCYGK